jgi:hypothetical protein
MEREGTGEVRPGEIVAQSQRREVGLQQRRLATELLADHLLDDAHVDVEERDQRPGVGDVAHQLPFPIALERFTAHPAERNA